MRRVLVIAPHADDEVLGCGGAIARYAADGWEVHVLVASASDVLVNGRVKASGAKRAQELSAACAILGVKTHRIAFADKENQLDTVPMRTVIGTIQDDMEAFAPDHVYLPLPSHHQDHRIVYDASMAALRPGGMAVKPSLVAAYEYTYTGWHVRPSADTGFLYKDIGATLDAKRLAWQAYGSQGREPEHPLSEEAIVALARTRGFEAGCLYAERFTIIRLID